LDLEDKGNFMELNWGNILHFNSEKDYYEVLGFLSKEEELIRVYTENNDKAGAWSGQGRMSLRNVSIDSLPEALKNAFETSADGRISVTHYVKNLKENHNFSREIDPTGSDFTKRLYKESLEKVLETVPEEYENDFYRGYHWNCEVIERIRNASKHEINWDEETVQEETAGTTEGKRTVYYTTKYERSSKNREAAIRIHGTKCMICGFDFEQKYGELGKGYIEVHHIKPLATLEQEVVINPETDLICVCANCHRMLHRFKNYIVTVEELKYIVDDNK
jgi:5-methylcytosine-specific restriction endonuclease McrA